MIDTTRVQLHIRGVVDKYNTRDDFDKGKKSDVQLIDDGPTEVEAPIDLVNQLRSGEITSEEFLKELGVL
jgi:hypothetical protein